MKTLVLISALTLAGCATMTPVWYKADGSAEQFHTDRYDCMAHSQMQVSSSYAYGWSAAAGSQETTNTALFKACMEAKGYTFTNRAHVESLGGKVSP